MSSDTASAPAQEKIWYDANCHCRAVQLRFKSLPLESDSVASSSESDPAANKPFETACCNCSICTKNGYLNVYTDIKTETEWVKGKETLSKYNYGSGMATHMFCPTCGSSMCIEADFNKVGMPERGMMLCVNVSLSLR